MRRAKPSMFPVFLTVPDWIFPSSVKRGLDWTMVGRPSVLSSAPAREEYWERTRLCSPHHTRTQHLGAIEGDIRAAVGNSSEEVEVLVLSALGVLHGGGGRLLYTQRSSASPEPTHPE
jgi:hypothetical protein